MIKEINYNIYHEPTDADTYGAWIPDLERYSNICIALEITMTNGMQISVKAKPLVSYYKNLFSDSESYEGQSYSNILGDFLDAYSDPINGFDIEALVRDIAAIETAKYRISLEDVVTVNEAHELLIRSGTVFANEVQK